jgi:hypothetical protein
MGVTVAVGTTIDDHSRTDPYELPPLRRMSGVEACIRIGMQNARRRNPPVQDWSETDVRFPRSFGLVRKFRQRMNKVGSRLGTDDDVSCCIYGAGRGGRTPTRLPSADFESAASASSAIPAYPHKTRREF